MSERVIIGVAGLIGSGKNTVADYLVNFQEFRTESFADSLKDAVSNIFGWDRTMLEGRTKASREWRETIDPYWSKRLGIYELTPRWVLQYFGTDVCRMGFHDDIWIASLENKILKSSDDIVISDLRFPNELKALKNIGAKTIWVRRGELPDWYDTAILANNGDLDAKAELDVLGVHSSEYSLAGSRFDYIIDNDGTIDELYANLAALI